MSLLDYFKGDPWLNVLFFILAITSIIISIFLYIKSKKEKIPTYNLRSFNLANNKIKSIKKLRMLYDNQEISDLTITKFAFWNAGSDTINHGDIASSDPIKLSIPSNCRILDAHIEYWSHKNNNIEINISSGHNELTLTFEYLDKLQGCSINIYHDHPKDEITVSGTIKGGKCLTKAFHEPDDIADWIFNNSILKIVSIETLKKNRELSLAFLVPIFMPILFFASPFIAFKMISGYKIPKEYLLNNE